jgi:hypothetical protein
MNITMLVYLAFLFVLLTPGQFVILPSINAPKLNITLTHAVLFALIWHVTHTMVETSKTQINL